MEHAPATGPFDHESVVRMLTYALSDLPVGLLVYHLEDPDVARSLRLLYANRAASEYTGADLSGAIGKRILEAFPGLASTDLPEQYADVAREGRARNIGAFEYGGDRDVKRAHYAVKAFPMPGACVGIVFENITTRRKVEEMVRRLREKGSGG